jgi:hypothetical protein
MHCGGHYGTFESGRRKICADFGETQAKVGEDAESENHERGENTEQEVLHVCLHLILELKSNRQKFWFKLSLAVACKGRDPHCQTSENENGLLAVVWHGAREHASVLETKKKISAGSVFAPA